MAHRFSQSMERLREGERSLIGFFTESTWARRDPDDPATCDFVAANPQEGVFPELVEALQRWTVPQDEDWYGDKLNEPYATRAVASGVRDRMVAAPSSYGHEVHPPEATSYLPPVSPDPDDAAFVERLARDKVFVMPGAIVEIPGRFRTSLTASDDMVERALPVFERAARGA